MVSRAGRLCNAGYKADKVGLSTDVSGMVERIEARVNPHVTAGQVLFRLDPLPFQLKLDQAQSQLDIVRDKLTALKATTRLAVGASAVSERSETASVSASI